MVRRQTEIRVDYGMVSVLEQDIAAMKKLDRDQTTAWQKAVNTEPSSVFMRAAAEATKCTNTDYKRKGTVAVKLLWLPL